MSAPVLTAKIVERFPVWFLFNPDHSPSGEILVQVTRPRGQSVANVFTCENAVRAFLDGAPQFAKFVSVPLFSPGGLLYFLDIIERRGATHVVLNEQTVDERLVPIPEVRLSVRS